MTPDRTAELAATIAATAETARRLAGAGVRDVVLYPEEVE